MKSFERSKLHSLSEIAEFIGSGRFRYAAQPIYRFGDAGKPNWFEWLVRPDFGDQDLGTAEFIQAVESLDLGLDLDTRTSADAMQWLSKQPRETRLTINVSSAAMSDHMFASHMEILIENSRAVPEQICFDLAVHAALSDLSGATRFVKTMRRMGCYVALGNGIPGNPVLGLFGPLGFVNYLKIDRKWVTSAPESPSHRDTLESIVDYAKRLNLEVIAEGVDGQPQLDLVEALGVDYYQGWMDGEPSVVAMTNEGSDLLQLVG